MNISKYKPANRFRSFPVTFNDFFDNFFGEEMDFPVNNEAFFRPSVDVVENDESFELHVAMPGAKKEDIKLDVSGDELMISGESRSKYEKKEAKYHVGEIRYGKFSRKFRLPENVNREGIEATFEDGLLNVVIPKVAESKPKTISIK